MPSFDLAIPHTLGKDAARSKLDSFVARLREKYPDQVSAVDSQWEDDRLSFGFSSYGIQISGTLTVQADQVAINGELPFAAMMFKGKIVDSIQQGVERALAWQGRPDAS